MDQEKSTDTAFRAKMEKAHLLLDQVHINNNITTKLGE